MGVMTKISGQEPANQQRPVRVVLVDDSVTVRSVFARHIDGEPDLCVVGKYSSAELALEDARKVDPDVILLDLEMPGMGGMRALPVMLTRLPQVQVMVVSSLTQQGAEQTLSALAMGAAETMPKPRSGEFNDEYCQQLLGKVRALGMRRILRGSGQMPSKAQPVRRNPISRAEVVGIGASTGGIHALCTFLEHLPSEFDLPILVTQHLPASFIPVFARQIELASKRKCAVAKDGQRIERNHVLVAPGDGHLTIRNSADGLAVAISRQDASSGFMPSVDPMLESIAAVTGGRGLGIILSGMGSDGEIGAKCLVDSGGTVYAQDAESSAVWGMPAAIAENGLAAAVLSPAEIAETITRFASIIR